MITESMFRILIQGPPYRQAGTLLILAVSLGLGACSNMAEYALSPPANEENIIQKKPLDPKSIPKFVEALVIPPAMPPEEQTEHLTTYHIAMRQFEQQVLPTGYPKTAVWGYGKADDPLPGKGSASSFHSPAFTIEAEVNERVRVKWINGLVDEEGNYLPHLLPVDPTLHWANPEGPVDTKPMFSSTPGHYRGPVPIVTHVHGAHVAGMSDGYPEAWYLPAAKNIPQGVAKHGSRYNSVAPTEEGAALFEYTNDQRAATLWYHDHALGLTRVNVYAGPAGFWLLRDDFERSLDLPGPAPRLGDPQGTAYYEIPLALQDRSFYQDGSLAYPHTRHFFDQYAGPYHPKTPAAPHWNPEVFGDTMIVNGRTWPYLDVEPRLYRFRILNGSNSRFMILQFDDRDLPFHQIGSDGGLLPKALLVQKQLLMGPAERVDVIIDFSRFKPGEKIVLLNLGPDEPYKGPNPVEPLAPADPQTTGLVMQFRVVALTDRGNRGSVPMSLPAIEPLKTSLPAREITLNEHEYDEAGIPVAALLGTGADGPLTWGDPVTENPMVGDVEIWEIINLTEDAHPVHLHAVMFQVIDRTPIDAERYSEAQEEWLEEKDEEIQSIGEFRTGSTRQPEANELGWKDTVIANPGEVTRIVADFDIEGLYVWHCHILEHEDNEMMRPYYIGPIPADSGLMGHKKMDH